MHTALDTWRQAQALDALVWSDLPANFTARTGGRPLTPEHAIAYLAGLSRADRRGAAEYLRRLPADVQTPIRQAVLAHFGWTPLPPGSPPAP